MSTVPVKAGIVGLGWWGKIMVDSVQRSDAIRFVAAANADLDAARPFAREHELRLTGSLDELVRDPEVRIVALATPHSQHVDQIVAAATAGKPVYSEKPLALTLAEARRAVHACEAAGVPLGLGNDKRFLPAVTALRELVGGGALGAVVHVEAQYSNDNSSKGLSGAWRASPAETPAGGLTGPGLHMLDALVCLAGDVEMVHAQLNRHADRPHPLDALAMLLRFTGGATGLLGSVRGVPDHFRLAVFGERGWAEVTDFGSLRYTVDGAEPIYRRYDDTLAVGALLESFARTVRDGVPFPVSTASMLATVAACEAAITSVHSGQPAWLGVPG
jgi:predicted dehydrogenase